MAFDKTYWEKRWQEGATGWDLGDVSPPLRLYIDQLKDKNLRILIPGCGNSYEAEYLFRQGFSHTHVADISERALQSFQKRVPDFPPSHLHCGDYFKLTGTYDLILEQTFFCALDPSLRALYVQHSHDLLAPGGKITGLLFDDPLMTNGPPFGGDEALYRKYFETSFQILTLGKALHSIPPRAGRELFVIMRRKP
jgi:SAM-dependent methyltransferase